ncbi:MAG: hypothetical protein VXZ96_10915 [Myxococcota bacterium]|nr:hypothetical protein [Myxococcota bacterium]
MPTLAEYIEKDTPIDEVGEFLDSLDHATRLAETQTLNRSQQRRLYDAAAQSQPLELAHFVPSDRADQTEVIHYGRNTLPLPSGLKRFEKRFCRPTDSSEQLFGYNEGATRKLIGPGYFVMHSTKDKPEWAKRGSLVVDYFQVPSSSVVSDWPKVVPNHKGLQVLVYHKTRDFMRGVSQHVSIGAAYKVEKPLGHYFILCRSDSQ